MSKFDRAIEWFKKKRPVSKEQWDEMALKAKMRAFYVAGVTQADVLKDVHDALVRAAAKGTTLAEFRNEVGAKLSESWAGSVKNEAWRTEVIFRTNVQSAYSAGRLAQLRDPTTKKTHPYWIFDAVLDGRTTPLCRSLHKTILPADDPWWNGHFPPLHFCCRSGIRALTESDATSQGITDEPPDDEVPGDWGQDPLVDWKPKTEKYSPSLKAQVESLLKKLPSDILEMIKGGDSDED